MDDEQDCKNGIKTKLCRHLMKDVRIWQNVMQVPRMEKVVVNIGVGEALDNAKALDAAVGDMTIITGQKPVVTKARKSIANFKLREGRAIGVKVTLRGERMWAFLDRLMNMALPRVRDFRGVSPEAFDGRGNYTLGLREQLVFPEIEYDKIDKVRGHGDHHCDHCARMMSRRARLLQMLGMPFKKGTNHGEKCMIYREMRRKYPVRGSQSLPALRAPAWLYSPLRFVPHLLPRVGAWKARSRRGQSLLVAGRRNENECE